MSNEEPISPEDEARHMQLMADYDEAMRREEIRISQLKAADHHTRCRDCGVFVDKSRWVKKDSIDAVKRQHRPLCGPCWSEYDYEY